MAHDARSFLRIGLLGWGLGVGLVGCSSVEPIEVAPSTCVEGQAVACACSGGIVSAKVCRADGVFAACQCESLSAGTSGDAAAGGSGGSGGTGVGGAPSGGSGGQGGRAGSGGSGGTPGGMGGSGAGGDAGEAGTTAGMGSGEGGMNGGSGGDAGDGGHSGEGGDGGDSGEGGDGGGEPQPAEVGELYGPCTPEGECNTDLICFHSNTGQGMTASYCTALCGQGFGQCHDPETGDVEPACVFNFCLLQACQGHQCPLGMSCVETEVSPPGGGVRTVAQCVYL